MFSKTIFKVKKQIRCNQICIRHFSTPNSVDIASQRAALDTIATSLGIKDKSDFYNIPVKEFQRVGGQDILQSYHNDPFTMLSTLYPDYPWLPWKFNKCPDGYWDNLSNQRQFLDWLGKNLGFKELSDWYAIGQKDFHDSGGLSMLRNKYAGSHSALLSAVYPEFKWLPWKFAKATNKFWSSIENQKNYLDWAANQLNVKEMSDWYNVSVQDLKKIHGTSLLKKYNDMLPVALATIYPEYKWLPWRFAKSPRNYWNNPENLRKFFSWAYEQLKLTSFEDWYKVQAVNIIKLGGSGIVFAHHSWNKALQVAYNLKFIFCIW